MAYNNITHTPAPADIALAASATMSRLALPYTKRESHVWSEMLSLPPINIHICAYAALCEVATLQLVIYHRITQQLAVGICAFYLLKGECLHDIEADGNPVMDSARNVRYVLTSVDM